MSVPPDKISKGCTIGSLAIGAAAVTYGASYAGNYLDFIRRYVKVDLTAALALSAIGSIVGPAVYWSIKDFAQNKEWKEEAAHNVAWVVGMITAIGAAYAALRYGPFSVNYIHWCALVPLAITSNLVGNGLEALLNKIVSKPAKPPAT